MAFDVTALSAYIEDQDFPLIASMQATGGLAEVVNIQTGIKDSSNLQFLDTDVIFQSDSCSRAGSGTTTFTQRTISVGAVAVHKDLCVKDLNGYWTQTMVKQGCAGEEELPAPIEGLLLDKIMNKTKKTDKIRALEAISKMMGLNEPEVIEHKHTIKTHTTSWNT